MRRQNYLRDSRRLSLKLRDVARLLRRTIAAISLILLLGTVGVWVRSYWVEDLVFLNRYPDLKVDRRPRNYELACWRGRALFTFTRYDYYGYGGEPGCTTRSTNYDDARFYDGIRSGGISGLGFHWVTQHFRAAATGGDEKPDLRAEFEFPIWSVALVLSVVPAFWAFGIWRRTRGIKQSRLGLCAQCGYDLRASSAVCPECGTPINPNPKVAESSFFRETRPLALAAVALVMVGGVVRYCARKSFDGQIKQLSQFKELKAAFSDHDKAKVELLVKAGAAADPSDLAYAMRDSIGRDERFALLMLDSGADLTEKVNSVLTEAIEGDSFVLARHLVEKGVPLNATYENGGTALGSLARRLESNDSENEKLKLAELLLARGADPNVADKTGVTPLHALALVKTESAATDVLRFARMLLDHGAQINAKDISDETPLHWAKVQGRDALAAFLISHGAKE